MHGRYKYLQRPLEESSLPSLVQYINRWSDAEREKFAVATGVMMSQGLASPACLLGLTKDHLVKNGMLSVFYHLAFSKSCADVSINVVTTIFRAYLAEQSMDHLATTLRKGGVKDLLAFFPGNKRQDKVLEEHFRSAGLPQVADWWAKRQNASLREGVTSALKEMLNNEDSHEDVSLLVHVKIAQTHFSDRSLPLSRASKRSAPCQILSSFSAFGKVSSHLLSGAPVKIRMKLLPSAK